MRINLFIKRAGPLMAILVLFGLATCLFIEPALALTHDESECAGANEHCCFICNSAGHQWNTSGFAALIDPPQVFSNSAATTLQVFFNSSSDSIFHPPPVSLRI